MILNPQDATGSNPDQQVLCVFHMLRSLISWSSKALVERKGMEERHWGFIDAPLPLVLAVNPWREPVMRHICCGGTVRVMPGCTQPGGEIKH